EALGGATVVDAGRGDAATRRHHQCEVASHAEADHTNLAIATVEFGQPAARCVEVADRSLPKANGRDQAPDPAAPIVEVGRQREVSLACQPVRLVTYVSAHAEGV